MNNPYLTKQLIAYIGNKRSLLPFLSSVFDTLELGNRVEFLDPFAGTGAVSRLAKNKGYKVSCNDWEHYSFIFNSCYIGTDKSYASTLFKEHGGIENIFEEFKSLKNSFDPYISRHYAPKDTDSADYITERLFYTHENGIFIDRARTFIEELYPENSLDDKGRSEKNILLASLLYEVSTHANTSGVFKACHKGFGGHGKDALGRIMTEMVMERPYLCDSNYSSSVSRMDALDFVKKISGDICYLDPPYNTHQYGSNYFMLNTVSLWDKPVVNTERGSDGRFIEKAGIRKDWKNTKSPYCYKKQAPDTFKSLMENIDSRYVVLSYNTEGIIPFNQLFDIMESYGKVDLHIQDYTLYRGGKQSLGRKTHNMELLLIVDRNKKADGKDRVKVERFLNEKKVLTKMKMGYDPVKIKEQFTVDSAGSYILDSELDTVPMFRDYKFTAVPENLSSITLESLHEIDKKLSGALCEDNHKETLVLISLLDKEEDKKVRTKLQKRLLVVYKKLAFKKYMELFNSVKLKIDKRVGAGHKGYSGIVDKIDEINKIAELRFKG